MNKARVSLSIDSTMRAALEQRALDESRSLNSLIISLLAEHVTVPKTRPSKWAARKQNPIPKDSGGPLEKAFAAWKVE
jgi:hypothetical protein